MDASRRHPSCSDRGVARSPDQASDGKFFTENTIISDALTASQTSWLYESQLKPGTYYVHVQGFDPSCFGEQPCETIYPWSNVLKLVMPKPVRRPTRAERKAMLAAVKRIAPPFWGSHLKLIEALVSNYAPWARAVAAGTQQRYRVQSELFAFRRLAGDRWRPYLIHADCHPPGLSATVRRELKIRCF
jgi:hypothetical protein